MRIKTFLLKIKRKGRYKEVERRKKREKREKKKGKESERSDGESI